MTPDQFLNLCRVLDPDGFAGNNDDTLTLDVHLPADRLAILLPHAHRLTGDSVVLFHGESSPDHLTAWDTAVPDVSLRHSVSYGGWVTETRGILGTVTEYHGEFTNLPPYLFPLTDREV